MQFLYVFPLRWMIIANPILSFVSKNRTIAPHLSHKVFVTLESTTYPGTTEEELRLVLEQESGMKAGIDFHLAYSPEREDPGRHNASVKTIPKVVGGFTHRGDLAEASTVKVWIKFTAFLPCKAAEATKLLENIFRSVNIALVNELKVVYEVMGIDVHEVIDAAARLWKLWLHAFPPRACLGGHCIPIDPFYLTWKAREFGKILVLSN